MANVTINPTNYWQVDFGAVSAKNPAKKRLAYGDDDYINHIALKRAVFLEFNVPSNAVYRHAIVTTSALILAPDVSHFYTGYWNSSDLDLSIGKTVSMAGYPKMFFTDAHGSSYQNMAVTNEVSRGNPATITAYNNRFFIGVINPYNNPSSPHHDFEWSGTTSLELTYTLGPFTISPSVTGGYLASSVQNKIKVVSNNVANMITQYAIQSGTFYYKKTSASNYSPISFTGDTVTIPANTLERDEEYNYYFTAVADDGTTATTEVYTVSTGDAVGTVTALSPNNMVAYGTPTFTWLYENELGNLQTAFDLQISADQSTWSDIATHLESADTAYTVSVPVGGNLYWRVRAYNQGDVVSEWSNILPFSNVLPPSPPTITGVSGAGRITVAWNAENQIAYQVMIGEHDSGWVYSTNKSYFLNDYLPDGVYEIKVRVTNGIGLASDWATMTYTQSGSVAGPSASIEMKEGYNEITISGAFDKYYILRNGVVVAQTTAGTYSDYFCNGTDNYVIRGVNADDTFGDSVLTGRYTCRRPALITRDNSILYINERLDEEPQISASNTLAVVAAEYLGRAKPVHHVGQMNTRTWSVSCSRSPVPGEIYFYRNFRGDKAWVICSNVQSTLNSIGVHEYQFTLEETDYKEAVDYEV